MALVAMMGATVVDVVGRHLFAAPLPGVVEMVEFAMTWATFAGIAAAFVAGGHITVDLVDTVAGPRTLSAVKGASGIAAAFSMAGLAWLGWRELGEALDWGDTTVDLGIPLAVFWTAIFGGYALGAVLAFAVLTRRA